MIEHLHIEIITHTHAYIYIYICGEVCDPEFHAISNRHICVLLNVRMFVYVLLLARTDVRIFVYVLPCISTCLHISPLSFGGKKWDKG